MLHPKSRIVAAAIAFFAALVATFWPVFGAGFVNWDDDRFIINNALFQGDVLTYVKHALSKVQFQAYHPLHLLSYLPDRLLWQHNAFGYHAFGLALHATACGLLAALLRRHVGWIPSIAATLVFALHPLRVECVAWVSARKDVLALALVVLAVLLEDVSAHRATQSARSHLRLQAAAVAVAALAMLAKTSSLVLPGLIFAWHVWIRNTAWRQAVRRTLPHFVLAAALAPVVVIVWQQNEMIWPQRPLPLLTDVAGTFGIYWLRNLWPVNLAALYPPVHEHHTLLAVLWSIAFVASLLLWKRIPRSLRFGIFSFHIALLPVSNIIPLYFRFADRYAVFSSLALTVPLAFAFERCLQAQQKKLRHLLSLSVVCVLLVLAVLSHRLSATWHDSLTLWRHAVEAQPQAPFAHLKLAGTYREQKLHADAVQAYLRAAMFTPRSQLALAGLFLSTCELVEAQGVLSQGTAARWQEHVRQAKNVDDLQELINEAAAAKCPRCAQTLLWLTLNVYPPSNDELMQMAENARQYDHKLSAEIYWRELAARGL